MGLNFKHVDHHTCSEDGLWMNWDAAHSHMRAICFEYWEELDSSAVPMFGKYNVQSGYVDLSDPLRTVGQWDYLANVHDIRGALKSCGYAFYEQGDGYAKPVAVWVPYSGDVIAAEPNSMQWRYVLASCAWGYGAKCVLGDYSGNNRRALFRQARADF